ncbi:MAG: hypothetical protein K0S08_1925 [Gammaproteobacteria bacterium]|jgi:hypothetical protein|nr:hypothetical protein [Gammaproteobacteria bacterium]
MNTNELNKEDLENRVAGLIYHYQELHLLQRVGDETSAFLAEIKLECEVILAKTSTNFPAPFPACTPTNLNTWKDFLLYFCQSMISAYHLKLPEATSKILSLGKRKAPVEPLLRKKLKLQESPQVRPLIEQLMLEAITKDDLIIVQKLLAQYPALCQIKNPQGQPIAYETLLKHQYAAFSFLLQAGADVYAEYDQKSIVLDLLQTKDKDKIIFIHKTLEHAKTLKKFDRSALAQHLLTFCTTDNFFSAIAEDDAILVEIALQKKPLLFFSKYKDMPALLYACDESSLDSFEVLLTFAISNNINIRTIKTANGQTLLSILTSQPLNSGLNGHRKLLLDEKTSLELNPTEQSMLENCTDYFSQDAEFDAAASAFNVSNVAALPPPPEPATYIDISPLAFIDSIMLECYLRKRFENLMQSTKTALHTTITYPDGGLLASQLIAISKNEEILILKNYQGEDTCPISAALGEDIQRLLVPVNFSDRHFALLLLELENNQGKTSIKSCNFIDTGKEKQCKQHYDQYILPNIYQLTQALEQTEVKMQISLQEFFTESSCAYSVILNCIRILQNIKLSTTADSLKTFRILEEDIQHTLREENISSLKPAESFIQTLQLNKTSLPLTLSSDSPLNTSRPPVIIVEQTSNIDWEMKIDKLSFGI